MLSHKLANGFISPLQRIRWTSLRFHSKTEQLRVAVALSCGELNCSIPWPQQRSGCIYAPSLYKTAISYCSDTRDLDGFGQLDPQILSKNGMWPDCGQTITRQWHRPGGLHLGQRPSVTANLIPKTAVMKGQKRSSHYLWRVSFVVYAIRNASLIANLDLALRHKICKRMKPGVWHCKSNCRDEHHRNCLTGRYGGVSKLESLCLWKSANLLVTIRLPKIEFTEFECLVKYEQIGSWIYLMPNTSLLFRDP